jgi:hypothetical protein
MTTFSLGQRRKKNSEIINKLQFLPKDTNGKWKIKPSFETVLAAPPANDFEVMIQSSNDEGFWDLVKKLRIECRRLVIDRTYQ